jgi:opacity protein-like surface antigen
MPLLRNLCLGVTLIGVLALGPAHAADVSYGDGLKDVGYLAIWNGPYFGVHGGGAWSSSNVTDVTVNGNTFGNDGSGAFGGGTIGYNWQFGRMVYSAEVDLGVLNVSHSAADPIVAGTVARQGAGVYGDITGRIGYAFDRTMIYAKGGFGFFNGDTRVTSLTDYTYKSNSYTGWAAGAGVEYKMTPAWSVKVEYLHFDVGDTQIANIGNGNRWNASMSLDTVKAGVNYEIIDTPAPLK